MSAETKVKWSEPEEVALTAVHARLQALVTDKALTRQDVVKALVLAASLGVSAEEFLTAHRARLA